jgi:hypothetical protein
MNEVFSTRPEPRLNEPLRDLNSDFCSARPEAEDREPDRTVARPLDSEPARDREPVRDLKIEFFTPRLDAEPSEVLKLRARPLI